MTGLHAAASQRTEAGQNFLARRPLLSFFLLAIVLTWLISLPSLLYKLPFTPFQNAGSYGPLLAALIVSAAMGGDELKGLLRRMTTFRFGLGWYLLTLFSFVVLYLLAAGIAGAPLLQSLSGNWPLIFTLYLPALFTTYLINPIGEETGWTGFAIFHLQKRFAPWLSAVILGVLWAVWHLPGFFAPGGLGPFNPVNYLFFILNCILIRILWTWVTNHARGSGIVGVLFHASSNAVSFLLIPRLFPEPSPVQLVLSGLYLLGMLLVVAVLLLIFTHARLSYRRQE
jgi:membrane protease YdiL (CAAX protease family)